jgi:hypothetical protein
LVLQDPDPEEINIETGICANLATSCVSAVQLTYLLEPTTEVKVHLRVKTQISRVTARAKYDHDPDTSVSDPDTGVSDPNSLNPDPGIFLNPYRYPDTECC